MSLIENTQTGDLSQADMEVWVLHHKSFSDCEVTEYNFCLCLEVSELNKLILYCFESMIYMHVCIHLKLYEGNCVLTALERCKGKKGKPKYKCNEKDDVVWKYEYERTC